MNFDKLSPLLKSDIEDSFPSGGGGSSFMMINAPTVLISRDTKVKNRIVPVYFIACQKNGENYSDQLLGDMYEGSRRMSLLRHRYEGKELGKCIVSPFLFHMQPSAKDFCNGIDSYLESLQSTINLVWQLEYCHVYIMHKGMNYEPSEAFLSLRT